MEGKYSKTRTERNFAPSENRCNVCEEKDAELFEARLTVHIKPTVADIGSNRIGIKFSQFAETWLHDHAQVHKTPAAVIYNRQVLCDYDVVKLQGSLGESILYACQNKISIFRHLRRWLHSHWIQDCKKVSRKACDANAINQERQHR